MTANRKVSTKKNKKPSVKKRGDKVHSDSHWTIISGKLTRPRGRPEKTQHLFKAIGEKIPFEFLNDVQKKLKADDVSMKGVYIAHDSMGYPRYIGRGDIFGRLKARRNAQVLELRYFSYFVVESPTHEREVETIMIRAAGPLLGFNNRKIRNNIQAGDIRDFEPGTKYIERQYKKGRRVRIRRKVSRIVKHTAG